MNKPKVLFSIDSNSPLGIDTKGMEIDKKVKSALTTLVYLEGLSEGCSPRYLERLRSWILYNPDVQFLCYLSFATAMAEAKALGYFLMSLFRTSYEDIKQLNNNNLSPLLLEIFEGILKNLENESTVFAMNVMMKEYLTWLEKQQKMEALNSMMGGLCDVLGIPNPMKEK